MVGDERLASTAEALGAEIERLRKSVDRQVDVLNKATSRNRRAIRWVAASLVVDLVLTVGATAIVAAIVDARNAQNEDREQLCALYGLILDADTPERRAAMEPEERARYEPAIDVIADGADTLGCDTGG